MQCAFVPFIQKMQTRAKYQSYNGAVKFGGKIITQDHCEISAQISTAVPISLQH